LQLVTKVGVFDVDDIIMNTTGTLIGYIVFRVSLSIARRRKIMAMRRKGYAKAKKTE
jgi:glycopeptide antibiotics resistance protein